MKKVVLSALLLATVAMSASAEGYRGNNGVTYSGPTRNAPYQCFYTNYDGAAMDEGISYWTLFTYQDGLGRPMPRGTEHFQVSAEDWDGYKATWAAPANFPDPATGGALNYTRWEYTFNPYGPQCKKATVHFNAFKLVFSECGDGHSRTCWLVQ